MEGSLKTIDAIIVEKYDAQNLLKYKAITEVTNLLRSVSEYAVNLNVERDTCLRRLFVRNNRSNGTTLRKWSFFCKAPMCDRLWTQGAAETVKVSTFLKLLFYCFAYISLV